MLQDFSADMMHTIEHLMFECSLVRRGEVVARQLGLNEAAIHAGTPFALSTSIFTLTRIW